MPLLESSVGVGSRAAADSPRGLADISRLFLPRAEQRQRRRGEEQHRQEAGSDKRRVDGGTEKVELYTDLTRNDPAELSSFRSDSDRCNGSPAAYPAFASEEATWP